MVIPSGARNLAIEALITLVTMCEGKNLCEILRCAQDDKHSTHFNQSHHGVVQRQAFRFKFLGRASGFDPVRRTD